MPGRRHIGNTPFTADIYSLRCTTHDKPVGIFCIGRAYRINTWAATLPGRKSAWLYLHGGRVNWRQLPRVGK